MKIAGVFLCLIFIKRIVDKQTRRFQYLSLDNNNSTDYLHKKIPCRDKPQQGI